MDEDSVPENQGSSAMINQSEDLPVLETVVIPGLQPSPTITKQETPAHSQIEADQQDLELIAQQILEKIEPVIAHELDSAIEEMSGFIKARIVNQINTVLEDVIEDIIEQAKKHK